MKDTNFVKIQTQAKYRINDIYFVSETKGFAVGGDKYTQGDILMTKDAGNTWELINDSIDYDSEDEYLHTLHSIDFLNQNIGEIVGNNGKILRTDNGGKTWVVSVNGGYLNFYKVKMISTNKTFLLSDAAILTSTNFWYYHESIDFTYSLKDLEFTDNNTAYLAGYGFVQKTEDAGKTWKYLDIKGDFFYDIDFVNKKVGYICGWQGGIFKTTDAGSSWKKIHNVNSAFSTRHHYESIDFIDENNGIVCGYNGELLYTNNAGKTWQNVNLETKTNFHSVFFLDKNTFFVGASEGQIFKVSM